MPFDPAALETKYQAERAELKAKKLSPEARVRLRKIVERGQVALSGDSSPDAEELLAWLKTGLEE